jgi:hypothetical protein
LGRGRQSRRGEKELEDIQRLKHENRALKRRISALEKQLQRIDYTRFTNLTQLVDKQRKEDLQLQNMQEAARLKEKWGCHKCGKGHLLLKIWDHPVKGPMYYRRCNLCDNRTKMQEYSSGVEGIKEEKAD